MHLLSPSFPVRVLLICNLERSLVIPRCRSALQRVCRRCRCRCRRYHLRVFHVSPSLLYGPDKKNASLYCNVKIFTSSFRTPGFRQGTPRRSETSSLCLHRYTPTFSAHIDFYRWRRLCFQTSRQRCEKDSRRG